jgi:hypothetical protein
MNTEKIDAKTAHVWKTKEGLIEMSEMTPEHLQNALHHAEHRFIQYHNQMIHIAEKVAIFEEKMFQLRGEAQRRGVEIKSLHEGKKSKFSILAKTYDYAEKYRNAETPGS